MFVRLVDGGRWVKITIARTLGVPYAALPRALSALFAALRGIGLVTETYQRPRVKNHDRADFSILSLGRLLTHQSSKHLNRRFRLAGSAAALPPT